jgi:hypothetical protein
MSKGNSSNVCFTKKQNKKTSEKPNLGSVSLAGGDGAGEGRLETERERVITRSYRR